MSKPPWLPPPGCDVEAYERAMELWVNAQLDELDEAALTAGARNADAYRELLRRRENLEAMAREQGLVVCSPPPPPRGRGPRPKPVSERMKEAYFAALDVTRIRALWRAHYGRKNRGVGKPPSAEWIAARRWGVSLEAVITHHARRHKDRPELFYRA